MNRLRNGSIAVGAPGSPARIAAEAADNALQWKCHTPNLLKEIMSNSGVGVLSVPLTILARLLDNVATRASQLNDPELNKLMLQLTLYEVADPESKAYSPKILREHGL